MRKYWKNKYKGSFNTLKEARNAARAQAEKFSDKYYTGYTDIFIESDGSYSIRKPCDKLSKFIMCVDKSGAKYIK